MPDGLDSLLNPSSVAVIGASEEPFTFSGATIHNLRTHGFTGTVHPVNPRRATVQGLPCHPSVADVPAPVDTAVITVPADAAVRVLEECEELGVRSATVVSAGFGEAAAGAAGQRNAARLEEIVRRGRIRVLGPNTAGLINLLDGYVPRAAVNHVHGPALRSGPVALLTQSGACSNIVFNRAQAHGVGIGLMCATGDDLDVTVWELARRALRDERVKVLMTITESVGDPGLVRDVALEARERGKPIVHLRLGSSEQGGAVVMTHSGSIAGDAEVARRAFQRWGIIDVADFDELWETARLFEAWGVPDGPDGGLGIFAFSGGEAALLADHAASAGVPMPAPSAEFRKRVDVDLAYAEAANPFDATGELVGRPEKLGPVLSEFVSSGTFSEVLVATPVYRAEAARRVLPQLAGILAAEGLAGHRIAFSMWPAGEFTAEQRRLLDATGAPVIAGSPRAVAAIAAYRRYRAPDRAPDRGPGAGPEAVEAVFASDRYADVRAGLKAAGLPFPPLRVARSAEETQAVVSGLRTPVVLKANVPSTVHKAAAGCVRTGVGSADEAAAEFAALQAAGSELGGDGVAVEETAEGSLQAILGARRDPHFGPVVLFGLGGSAADFLDDSAVELCEGLDEQSARDLLAATGLGRYLLAACPGATETVVAALLTLGGILAGSPRIAEIDLNPVLIDPTRDRAMCVDGRVMEGES